MKKDITPEEINSWLIEEYNYDSDDRRDRMNMIMNLSPEAKDVFVHLYETGELSPCGHEDFDISQLQINRSTDDLGVIAMYDYLIKNASEI